jgi:KDO2-lipid IV(A) lauroyltransferase
VTKHFLGATFAARFRDRSRAKAEFDALSKLQSLGVPVPRPLEYGPHPEGGFLVSMQLLQGARTADEALADAAADPVAHHALLTKLAHLLAALHNAGLDQGDLHGGNALVDESGRAFGIDFHKAKLRAPGSLSGALLERDLVVLCASHRERLSPRDQARFLVAWFRELEPTTQLRLPSLRHLAGSVERGAVRRRRKVCAAYEQPGSRWFRASSSVRFCDAQETSALLPSDTSIETRIFARSSLDTERLSTLLKLCRPHLETKVQGAHILDGRGLFLAMGSEAEVQRLWGRAARIQSHNLAGPWPLALGLGQHPFVLLEFVTRTGGPSLDRPIGLYRPRELSIAPTAQEFAELGQALSDRGLQLSRGLPAAFWATQEGRLCLSPFAELVAIQTDAPDARAKNKRRESRQQLFQLWPKCNGPIARPIVRAGLHGLAAAARLTSLQTQILTNLKVTFPGDEQRTKRRRIAGYVRQHMARLASEWGRLGRGPSERDWLESRVVFDESIEHFDELHSRGKGVLIVTPHLGNWELLAPKLVARGCRGAVVGRRRLRDPGGALLEHMRAPWGFDTLPQDGSPREILRRLRDGQVIGILPDLEVPRLAGTRLPFLGKEALVMTAPAALARAAKVPLLPATCVLDETAVGGPQARSPYRIHFAKPIERNPADSNDVATSAWLHVFESWIRRAPSQWIWYQDRWRTPPSPADSVPLSSLRAAQKRSQA